MKLFCLIGAASAASFLQNIDMNPDDANYNLKLSAFLKAMGVDVNTDAFFAEDNPTNGGISRTQNGDLDLRALKQLKLLVSSQMSQELKDRAQVTGSGFGLYCYYGCHCLTDDDHVNEEYGLVGGKPIDNIDKTCQQMGTCYRCLQDKYKDEDGNTTCKPETTKYRFSFFEDGSIDCSKNKPGCKLDLCLCDKEFAETVATHEHEWMPENHVTRGGFNRFETCKVAPKGISGGSYETCCGMDDFPNVGVKKTNHNGCCGPYGFNSDSQTCCNTYDGGYTVLNGNQVC